VFLMKQIIRCAVKPLAASGLAGLPYTHHLTQTLTGETITLGLYGRNLSRLLSV